MEIKVSLTVPDNLVLVMNEQGIHKSAQIREVFKAYVEHKLGLHLGRNTEVDEFRTFLEENRDAVQDIIPDYLQHQVAEL